MAVLATRYTLRPPENGRSHYFFTENDMHTWLRKQINHCTYQYSGLLAAFRAVEVVVDGIHEDGYARRRGLCAQRDLRGACMSFSVKK